jgi:hypothetical protein
LPLVTNHGNVCSYKSSYQFFWSLLGESMKKNQLHQGLNPFQGLHFSDGSFLYFSNGLECIFHIVFQTE